MISHLLEPIQSSFQVGNWRSSIFSVKIFEISRNYQSLEKRLEIWEGDCFSFLWMIYWVFKRINFSFYIFCTYPVFPRCLYLNLSDDIFVFVRSVELIFVTWEDCAAGAEGGRSLSPFEEGFPDQIACKLSLWWSGLWLQ